jgi:hypothetical protein
MSQDKAKNTFTTNTKLTHTKKILNKFLFFFSFSTLIHKKNK